MSVIKHFSRHVLALSLATAGGCFTSTALAGAQTEGVLSASVRAGMQRAVADQAAPKLAFPSQQEAQFWLTEMSDRLKKKIPDEESRREFLSTVHYEAVRAGLDPHLVLSLIEVESGFNKYAVSRVGARGYMQVMPFWVKSIGTREHNLFHLRVNLRYGCTILRYYVDMEKGNLYRALGRYNGSLGQAEYPNLVKAAWHKHWTAPIRTRSKDKLIPTS
ncbi:MAG TPA: transglycosylase SLT domain-containing protein [Gallionellaceae bacterium]|nr:transglycosylase SLT domain-containing protein [Gallionellaceae bacterium]